MKNNPLKTAVVALAAMVAGSKGSATSRQAASRGPDRHSMSYELSHLPPFIPTNHPGIPRMNQRQRRKARRRRHAAGCRFAFRQP